MKFKICKGDHLQDMLFCYFQEKRFPGSELNNITCSIHLSTFTGDFRWRNDGVRQLDARVFKWILRNIESKVAHDLVKCVRKGAYARCCSDASARYRVSTTLFFTNVQIRRQQRYSSKSNRLTLPRIALMISFCKH